MTEEQWFVRHYHEDGYVSQTFRDTFIGTLDEMGGLLDEYDDISEMEIGVAFVDPEEEA